MNRIFYPSLLVLVILQGFGFSLAAQKPLWNDELFTQTSTLSLAYKDILLGKNNIEGNIAPFFYIQQKAFCDIFRFKTPQTWMDHQWQYIYPFANIFLRILPVFWMSSFFLLLFIYFSYRFNISIGILGLLIGLTSPILWLYWAEARPYGLWVLLTAFQMVLFMEILEKGVTTRKWLGLSLTQILLSLTCVLSIFQILSVSLMLLFKERRWQSYVPLLAVPLFFIFYYRPHGPANDVIFLVSILQMFQGVLTGGRPYILLIYGVLLMIWYRQKNNFIPPVLNKDTVAQVFPFFLCIILMVTSFIVFLSYMQHHATGQGQYLVTRHLIFLAPINIIGITFLTGLVWQDVDVLWFKILLLATIAWFLIWHVQYLIGSIIQLIVHSPYFP